jgi:UDP-glucuronate 4-epimerase
MHVFVTGAAGFVGSHVVEALLRRGDTVVGLDNLNDYYAPARKRANLAELHASAAALSALHPLPSPFRFFEGDVRNRALLAEIFDAHAFDAVVHLAAMAGVRNSIEDPHLYVDVNLVGTLNVLDAARDHGTGNVVLASTSSVYGATTRIPFVEIDLCDRPLAPYPATKRAAEMLAFTYHHLYGLNVTALRFFTVYGPRNRPDMMAYKILDSIYLGREAPLYNGGQMVRDWTYVEDIAAGVVAAAARPLGYEVINLGRGEPTLLADFVHLLEALAGRPAVLRTTAAPDADMATTFADISKARRLLDYDPKTSVQEGVQGLWEWYRRTTL